MTSVSNIFIHTFYNFRKTVSHDWDQVHKEGKTMFRLPRECITGHVEGWILHVYCSLPLYTLV